MMVDPLASSFPSYTPYHYVHNNPINLIDPTGMSADNLGVSETTSGGITYRSQDWEPTLNKNEVACCPDGGDGDWEDMKEDIRQMGRGSVGRFIDWVSEVVAPGSGDSQSSGIEQITSFEAPGNNTGPNTEAEDGSDKLIDIGPGDMAGGGGTGVNPVSRVANTLNKTMPASVRSPQQFGKREVDSTAVITGGSDSKPGSFYMVPTTQKDSMTKVINERGY